MIITVLDTFGCAVQCTRDWGVCDVYIRNLNYGVCSLLYQRRWNAMWDRTNWTYTGLVHSSADTCTNQPPGIKLDGWNTMHSANAREKKKNCCVRPEFNVLASSHALNVYPSAMDDTNSINFTFAIQNEYVHHDSACDRCVFARNTHSMSVYEHFSSIQSWRQNLKTHSTLHV